MIFLFTWNNSDYLNEYIKKWKTQFIEKYGDFNFAHIKNIEELDINAISENLLSTSFLSEKKMILIENIEKIEKDESKKEFLLSILEKIPEENNIIFTSNSLQDRSKLYKKIAEFWEVKKFDLENNLDIKTYIRKKYQNKIENSAIDKIMVYKSYNLPKIINELDKLFITIDFVKENHIVDFIVPEFEETVFAFIDKILTKNKSWALKDLDIILENSDIYIFYNMMIWNLRNYLYITFLKNLWYKKDLITRELSLWNRAFLINKPIKYNFIELFDLYEKFINFDKNMKLGKLIWSSKDDLKHEIQKILILI